uniref:Poly [ADP-ribose] polymerase n=1 Tax=Nothobranchius kuhntae TaxID=321403 RepID=A0A1A8KC07_NOTKU
MHPKLCCKHDSSTLVLAMLAIRSSEEESTELEEMDTSEPNWCWFYLAECGVWHMFEIDPSAACSVTSAQIEQCYNRNQRGVMEFYTAKYTYRLDFSVMRQINVTTGKQRPIKRSLHSATGFRFICDNLALPVPCHWERINTDETYQLIQLSRDTYEFKEVARLYERTMDHPLKSIQRIQNLDLWEFFCRLTGSHGDVYGKGSYFARDAKYSSKFCHTTGKHNTTLQRHGLAPPIFANEPHHKTMFLARVLVGEYTVGRPMYCRPPSKDASFTNFYDSCVDDMANPKIYVIFDSNQIYPEYLIEFY